MCVWSLKPTPVSLPPLPCGPVKPCTVLCSMQPAKPAGILKKSPTHGIYMVQRNWQTLFTCHAVASFSHNHQNVLKGNSHFLFLHENITCFSSNTPPPPPPPPNQNKWQLNNMYHVLNWVMTCPSISRHSIICQPTVACLSPLPCSLSKHYNPTPQPHQFCGVGSTGGLQASLATFGDLLKWREMHVVKKNVSY